MVDPSFNLSYIFSLILPVIYKKPRVFNTILVQYYWATCADHGLTSFPLDIKKGLCNIAYQHFDTDTALGLLIIYISAFLCAQVDDGNVCVLSVSLRGDILLTQKNLKI
jgi:hypothetical protein